jgi:phosphatidylglycerophosphatase A
MSKNLLLYDFLSTGFFTGYITPAPGTWGSLAAWLMYVAIFMGGWIFPLAFLVFLTLVILLGIYTSGMMERFLGETDPSRIVIDEWAGIWLALFAIPQNMLSFFLAFVLFRIFDIVKPWPANISQKLPGGWGIMTDDIIAGVYTIILIRVIL